MEVSVSRANLNSYLIWPELNLEELTISEPVPLARPVGYQLDNSSSLMVKAFIKEVDVEGFADGVTSSLESRATSEAIERLVMISYSRHTKTSDTSSGWASHVSFDHAIENALAELTERDVALRAWEQKLPMYIIPDSMWPAQIKNWHKRFHGQLEYSNPKIVLSESGNGCAISVYLFNNHRNCVAAHSSKLDLESTILSAFSECLRAAHSALRFEHFSETKALHQMVARDKWNPGTHSLAYAYDVQFPDCVKFLETSSATILKKWQRHQLILSSHNFSSSEVLCFRVLDRFVVRVRNSDFKNIYWGPTKNRNELINQHPHTVG